MIDQTSKKVKKDLFKSDEDSLYDQDDNSSKNIVLDKASSVTESPTKKSCAKDIQNSDETDEDLDDDKNEDSAEEEDLGNPSREPGEDAVREIEPDHLLPFKLGWKREVIIRKGNGQVCGYFWTF